MPRAGTAIALCVLALLSIGVLMVHSAGLTLDPHQHVTLRSILLSRSSAYMALALLAMAAASRLPLHTLTRPRGPARWTPLLLLPALAMLLLVYAPVIGHEVNGSHRWIRVPALGFTFQPSEFAKWTLILAAAWYGARAATHIHRFRDGLLPALAVIAIVAGLVAKEDLGTGVLIAAAATLVLLAAGARLWHLALIAPAALAACAALVVTSPYRVRRLLSFADPWSDPDGAGYHMIQSLSAVANGRIFGRGLGFGMQKFGYLPEDRTDFLFAVICEELGIAGAAAVLALYATLVTAGLAVTRNQTNPMLRLTALGIVATLAGQAIINLFVVTGLAPTKGIALPLLSSGGTGWILTAGSLGLLVAMDRAAPAADAIAAHHTRAQRALPSVVVRPAAPRAPRPTPPIPEHAPHSEPARTEAAA